LEVTLSKVLVEAKRFSPFAAKYCDRLGMGGETQTVFKAGNTGYRKQHLTHIRQGPRKE